MGRNLIQVNQKKHLKSNTSHQTENGTEEQVKEPTKLPPKSQTKALTNSNTVESQHKTKNIEAVHGKKEREPSVRPSDKHLNQHNAQETLDVQQNKEPSSDVKSKKEEAITETKSAEGNQTQENHTKHLKEREPVRKTNTS